MVTLSFMHRKSTSTFVLGKQKWNYVYEFELKFVNE